MKRWLNCITIAFLLLTGLSACVPSQITTLPARVPFPSGTFVNAGWSWEFNPDGTFVSSGPAGSETGSYVVNGSRVVITCQCCGVVEGTYSWTFNGAALKFSAVDDQCTNRKGVVDASTWIRK